MIDYIIEGIFWVKSWLVFKKDRELSNSPSTICISFSSLIEGFCICVAGSRSIYSNKWRIWIWRSISRVVVYMKLMMLLTPRLQKGNDFITDSQHCIFIFLWWCSSLIISYSSFCNKKFFLPAWFVARIMTGELILFFYIWNPLPVPFGLIKRLDW